MKSPSSETVTNRLAAPKPSSGNQPILDWSEAQSRTNFVIITPRKGSPWKIAMATVRGESKQHHATVRYVLQDAEKRRLRVKQYFHDWWIPTIPDISFRNPGRPILVGEELPFVGRDYRRHDGSCGHRWGTGVEFSAEAGTLNENDWIDLWAGLEAIDTRAPTDAKNTTFAARNYWNRWKRTDAPWDSTEISSLTWSPPTTETLEACSWAVTADAWAPLPGVIDSLGQRTGPMGPEVQAVFRNPMTLNCTAWLRVLKTPPKNWRPLIDSGEVNRPNWEKATLGGTAIERASMDPTVGNWFYAWKSKNGRAFELHLRARRNLDQKAADLTIERFLA